MEIKQENKKQVNIRCGNIRKSVSNLCFYFLICANILTFLTLQFEAKIGFLTKEEIKNENLTSWMLKLDSSYAYSC